MKFPQTIKRGRGANVQKVVIYGRTPSKPSYRVVYYRGGERLMEYFSTYSNALARANAVCEELARSGRAPALSSHETEDARAALEILAHYCRQTGRTMSLTAAVRIFCDAAQRLGSPALMEAVDKYLEDTTSLRPVPLAQAAAEYLEETALRTKPSRPGERPQISPEYFRHVRMHLRQFVDMLPGHQTTDITKKHLEQFFKALAQFTPKARNHYRTDLGAFLRWCVAKDYLHKNHRLFETHAFRLERAHVEKIEIYTPEEYQAMLNAAPDLLRPALAILGLAGLRDAELYRLQWEDVWSKPGHVEIGARIAKTRQRRLVPICPALAAWLAPCRQLKGAVWPQGENQFHAIMRQTCAAAGVTRKRNALRHSYISYRLALVNNAAQVALEAGNSPQIIFQNYRELVTPEDAQRWFAVQPKTAANVISITNAAAL